MESAVRERGTTGEIIMNYEARNLKTCLLPALLVALFAGSLHADLSTVMDEFGQVQPIFFDLEQEEQLDWIERLEANLDGSPGHRLTDVASMKVGDLLQAVGQFDRARARYVSVAEDESFHFSYRMAANLAAARCAVEREGDGAMEALVRLDDFEKLILDGRSRDPHFQSGFDYQYENLDVTRSNYVEMIAERRFSGMKDALSELDPETRHAELTSYARDIELAASLLESAIEKGANRPPAEMYHRAGRLYTTAAQNYRRAGDEDSELAVREFANRALKTLLSDHSNSRYRVDAATCLLRLAVHELGPTADFARYCREVVQDIEPAHQILSFLRAQALVFSDEAEALVGANKMFEVVMALEQDWFPDEYRDHVNYQWSLLWSVRNNLQLGNVWAAGAQLDALAKLELQGDVFQNEYRHLRKVYGTYLERSFADFGADRLVVTSARKVNQAPRGETAESSDNRPTVKNSPAGIRTFPGLIVASLLLVVFGIAALLRRSSG